MAPSQQPLTLSSSHTQDDTRKRVSQACERCRVKKAKCDGHRPCSRCKATNTICYVGTRVRLSEFRVHPKGYTEILERQQSQLVAGLQEMYRRLHAAGLWPGESVPEKEGYPLSHDILACLNLLEERKDGSGELEPFEDDISQLENKMRVDSVTSLSTTAPPLSDGSQSTDYSSPTTDGSSPVPENASFFDQALSEPGFPDYNAIFIPPGTNGERATRPLFSPPFKPRERRPSISTATSLSGSSMPSAGIPEPGPLAMDENVSSLLPSDMTTAIDTEQARHASHVFHTGTTISSTADLVRLVNMHNIHAQAPIFSPDVHEFFKSTQPYETTMMEFQQPNQLPGNRMADIPVASTIWDESPTPHRVSYDPAMVDLDSHQLRPMQAYEFSWPL